MAWVFSLASGSPRRSWRQRRAGLRAPSKSAPPLRAIAPELDALEGEMLAAYKPPASIDSHPQFIRSSAALKQARELDDAGLRYGALHLYLDARLRLSCLMVLSGEGRPKLDGVPAAVRGVAEAVSG